MSNIVLATDGSRFSDAAARAIAAKWMFHDGVIVHVVHCEPDLSPEVKPFVSHKELVKWQTEQNAAAMRSVVDILRRAGVTFEVHGLVGFAPERIVELARAVNAVAIVMGTHGRDAFLDAVVGWVARRVLSTASCPVVLVKPPGIAS
ncbi:universal stress protein [Cupriavidus respiraculi]|uniref:UspA domain-containing protein n=1 Tax=Cupriavidus respiraculi TaxID=195930 RepID=A0ABM8WGW4_9BURK|nr:universal stress protein [Cupriavidus respiraculi]CAG9166600.1 hypothetical protein LMG21510_00450 [Cupriavidus respiraculi]